jgi:hypothetical protein
VAGRAGRTPSRWLTSYGGQPTFACTACTRTRPRSSRDRVELEIWQTANKNGLTMRRVAFLLCWGVAFIAVATTTSPSEDGRQPLLPVVHATTAVDRPAKTTAGPALWTAVTSTTNGILAAPVVVISAATSGAAVHVVRLLPIATSSPFLAHWQSTASTCCHMSTTAAETACRASRMTGTVRKWPALLTATANLGLGMGSC